MTRPAKWPVINTIWFTNAFAALSVGVAIAIALSLSSCAGATFEGDSSAPAQPSVEGAGDGDERDEDLAANGGISTDPNAGAAAGALGAASTGTAQGNAVPLTDALAECTQRGGNWNGSQCVSCGQGFQWDATANSCVYNDATAGNPGTSGGPAITADQIQQIIPLITTMTNNIPAGGGPFEGCGC
jgi:hypothetical protein